jgi:hypothetical protein
MRELSGGLLQQHFGGNFTGFLLRMCRRDVQLERSEHILHDVFSWGVCYFTSIILYDVFSWGVPIIKHFVELLRLRGGVLFFGHRLHLVRKLSCGHLHGHFWRKHLHWIV